MTTNNSNRTLLQVLNITQATVNLLTEHQRLELVWRMTDEQIDEVLLNIKTNQMKEQAQEIFENDARHEVADEFYTEVCEEGYSIEEDEDEEEMENFEERMWDRMTLLMN